MPNPSALLSPELETFAPKISPAPCGCFPLTAFTDVPRILRGAQQVLAVAGEMDALRLALGRQHDLSTDIRLILSRHNSRQRRPVLVLLGSGGTPRAAVIFLERCLWGFGIGVLRAGDPTGDGAVIAAEGQAEAALAAALAAVLAQRRCHTATASLSGAPAFSASLPANPAWIAQTSLRSVHRMLPLAATLDETLHSRFTPRKRKNLLYHRRKLFATQDVEFVPEIPAAEIEAALTQLSAHSWPLRTPVEIALHSDFLRRHPECFSMGIRLRGGPWLSLVTGWRAAGITHMPWQLNHERYKHASLMQVMRTCLMEHEIQRGQQALSWVGGTVSFQTACTPEPCLDVLISRRGLANTLLRRVIAPLLYRRRPDEFEAGSLMLLLANRPSHP